jgi:hypothetical protein
MNSNLSYGYVFEGFKTEDEARERFDYMVGVIGTAYAGETSNIPNNIKENLLNSNSNEYPYCVIYLKR